MPIALDQPETRSIDWLRREFPELGRGTQDLIAVIKQGLPADRVEKLRDSLDVQYQQIATLLSIPTSTLARRRQSGRLDKDESERAYRIAHLTLRAAETFGSLARGREWLKKPQYALGGVTPLEFSDTEPGAREVEDLLLRIEHGIPA